MPHVLGKTRESSRVWKYEGYIVSGYTKKKQKDSHFLNLHRKSIAILWRIG